MLKGKKQTNAVFLNGGNRADGSRFEEGDMVPFNLSPAERRAFLAMGCISGEVIEEGSDETEGDE